MIRTLIPALLGTFLAACAAPDQTCLAAANGDLAALDARIAEAEGSLARGHVLREVTVTEPEWTVCRTDQAGVLMPDVEGAGDGPSFCLEAIARKRLHPVAIDPAGTRKALAAMRADRPAIARAATTAAQGCASRPAAG